MPTLAVLSDTHVPSRARAVPDWVLEAVREADHTVHAGDFDAATSLSTIREAAASLTAVRGNTDPPSLDLPRVDSVTVGGRTVVVTHGDGPRYNYAERVAETVRDEAGPDAVGVAGHTHEPTDRTVEGVRLLNPGSATGAAPAREATMFEVVVEDGDVTAYLERGERV
ncbi:MAG: metallophosphoesterase family protein [Halobacteriaceae archaeon]